MYQVAFVACLRYILAPAPAHSPCRFFPFGAEIDKCHQYDPTLELTVSCHALTWLSFFCSVFVRYSSSCSTWISSSPFSYITVTVLGNCIWQKTHVRTMATFFSPEIRLRSLLLIYSSSCSARAVFGRPNNDQQFITITYSTSYLRLIQPMSLPYPQSSGEASGYHGEEY